jgi:cell fate (sporulation/competence/biofilm development) regulator YmcA (YheA/YmcA/DUF963 family)
MGEYYKRKNPPGAKRGPKPEYFTEEKKAEMSERGKKGRASKKRALTMEIKREQKKKRFLKNFEKHHALALASCKASKIGYQTYQAWRRDDVDFNQACKEIEESVSDYVENKLLELIDGPTEQKLDVKGNVHDIKLAPSFKAVEYFLSSKAKDRGFGKGIDLPEGGFQIVLTPATPKAQIEENKPHPIDGKDEDE